MRIRFCLVQAPQRELLILLLAVAAIANIVNSDGILTDLSYLDDLLGGPDAIGYQIEVI